MINAGKDGSLGFFRMKLANHVLVDEGIKVDNVTYPCQMKCEWS